MALHPVDQRELMGTRDAPSDVVRRVARIGGWLWLRLRPSPNAAGLGAHGPLPVHAGTSPTATVVPINFGPVGSAALVEIRVVSAKGEVDSGAAVDPTAVRASPD